MTKPLGIDYGRYTTWARPVDPPQPIDFVIAGVTSGTYQVKSFDVNVPALQLEKRLMTYHFYESGPAWLPQGDLFAKSSALVKSRALWVDYERSTYSKLDKRTAFQVAEMLYWLGERFPRVGIYANIYDFVAFFQKYVGDLADTVEWWVAYPPKNNTNPDIVPKWDYIWGGPNRSFESCRFLQYSWTGDAQLYGATNDKKSMDLDSYLGTMAELDEWLDIDEDPGTPVPPPVSGCACGEVVEKVDALAGHVDDLTKNLSSHHLDVMEVLGEVGTVTPPPVEPGDWVTLKTSAAEKKIPLSWTNSNNNKGKPIVTFYPNDAQHGVKDRVLLVPGSSVIVKKGLIVADGRRDVYRLQPGQNLDYYGPNRWTPGIELYIENKFIV